MVALIRRLRNASDDIRLGTGLVREYVVATVEETRNDVEVILTLIPELHDFAGHYLQAGAFLVAETGTDVAGGVGVTPGSRGECEMNRLWTRPGFRRDGLGRALCSASMDTARELGFRRMTLDVLPTRIHALALYRSLGFVDTAPRHDYAFEMVPLGLDL